ncbi:monooxygenase [Streptomyces sp. NBRC 110611]|nr:monooxygenase [Streptomyces sp. NBRC 110611]
MHNHLSVGEQRAAATTKAAPACSAPPSASSDCLIAERRAHPAHLLTALLSAYDADGNRLSNAEVSSQVLTPGSHLGAGTVVGIRCQSVVCVSSYPLDGDPCHL